ncbi:hypothetical protein COB21_00455 [Candidatus Aerophobetes bacterium]|uniref:DUF177 domain-containing protein n=1 Tax=Aerophobetes bacterium TaxID=2030807 RepID=A0A2A4X7K6_UNCAE|nr:MAG: hypothetical protein COB21_00455 [Candidatus Aerophobetes bacterium]
MKDILTIYIDRLSGHKQETLSFTLEPSSLFDVEELGLFAENTISIQYQVYIASDFLIINAQIHTCTSLPCHICNRCLSQKINIPQFYFTQALEEIPHKVFSLKPIFREAILLQLPSMVECEGNCPERSAIKKYMKTEKASTASYHPFADL